MSFRWTKFKGVSSMDEVSRIRAHPIYQMGNVVLVWVTETDLYEPNAEFIGQEATCTLCGGTGRVKD